MADALAVSGLAASIISLGIQVGGAIIKYLDAIKGRDENIGTRILWTPWLIET